MAHLPMLSSLVLVFLPGLYRAQLDYTESKYYMEDYRNHPCNRVCEDNSPPRLCQYTWLIESYWTMSKACGDCPFVQSDCMLPHCVATDGVSRGIITANRRLPGPPVEVCEGDTIEVTLYNDLQNSEGTSIHWHGMLQEGTPYMDGVSMITQCPVSHHATFTYRFEAKDPGTHFWHGHSGMQRADGLFGAIVVRRPPSKEPHLSLYDLDLSEHVILVNDWLVESTLSRFVAHHHDDGDNKPELMLINGMGEHEGFTREGDNATYYTPRAKFTVEPGRRYRFRVISNAILNCPIQISVDDHTLIMIASDGNSFQPFVADTFNIFAGERFDFILTADKAVKNYWLRARGMADCSVKEAHMEAVIHYVGAPDEYPTENTTYADGMRDGILLNPWNTPGSDTQVEVSRMIAEAPDDDVMTAVPDKKFYLGMDFHKVDNFKFNNPVYYPLSTLERGKHLYSPQINHITSQLPKSPPLTQYHDVDPTHFCDEFTLQKHCDVEYCSCIHKLQVALGDVVELVVIDKGVTFNANHPMHLHGYKFRTMAIGKINSSTSVEQVKEMDLRGELGRANTSAPLKDTVTVPDGGYTIMRFKADNPGMWFFHCHIEFHVDIGMSLIVQVGDSSEFPRKPKNFPTCGDWHPDMDTGDDDDDDDDNDDGSGSGSDNPIVVQCVTGTNGASSLVLYDKEKMMVLLLTMMLMMVFSGAFYRSGPL